MTDEQAWKKHGYALGVRAVLEMVMSFEILPLEISEWAIREWKASVSVSTNPNWRAVKSDGTTTADVLKSLRDTMEAL